MPDIDTLMRYEAGDLCLGCTMTLFGDLIRTGQAWTLQGFYGRSAARLIELGRIDRDGTVLDDDDLGCTCTDDEEEWEEASSHPSYWSSTD